jgi:hypothetical protein
MASSSASERVCIGVRVEGLAAACSGWFDGSENGTSSLATIIDRRSRFACRRCCDRATSALSCPIVSAKRGDGNGGTDHVPSFGERRGEESLRQSVSRLTALRPAKEPATEDEGADAEHDPDERQRSRCKDHARPSDDECQR